MSENLRVYTTALYLLDAVARRVPDSAWDAPTCCSEWSVREVGGHAAWGIKNLGSVLLTGDRIAEQAEAEVLGDHPAEEMRAVITGTLAALDRPGVLQREIPTPFGTGTVDDSIGFFWVDALTHTWDMADGAGIDHGIDDATAARALAQMEPASDGLRARVSWLLRSTSIRATRSLA